MSRFHWVSGLSGLECDEFNQWVFSQNAQILADLLLEYQKLMMAGLTLDSASYLYEETYETHLVPYNEASAYFLFVRVITNNEIVSLGYCPMERGAIHAVNLLSERTRKYLGKAFLRGFPRNF
jgi:hypothetical protein